MKLVLATKQRLAITALGSLIHVYPTLAQINQQAGLDAILKNFSAYKKWLSYYFKVWRRRTITSALPRPHRLWEKVI